MHTPFPLRHVSSLSGRRYAASVVVFVNVSFSLPLNDGREVAIRHPFKSEYAVSVSTPASSTTDTGNPLRYLGTLLSSAYDTEATVRTASPKPDVRICLQTAMPSESTSLS